jgi:hypothetical protein
MNSDQIGALLSLKGHINAGAKATLSQNYLAQTLPEYLRV